MTDSEKIEALVVMLLAFRHVNHLTEVIDAKLAEICPVETARMKAVIEEGLPSTRPN